MTLTPADQEWFTTRAVSRRAYHEPATTDHVRRVFTGFRFGRRGGPLFARVYRKSFEAAANDPVRARWQAGGYRASEHGADVWRIEIEVRARLLRELRCGADWLPREPEDILAHHLTSVWRYAIGQWLILHEKNQAASRISRTATSRWWKALAETASFEPDPQMIFETVRRAERPPTDGLHLLQMSVGVLASFAAAQGHVDWAQTRDAVDDYVRRVLTIPVWQSRVATRTRRALSA